TGISAQSGITTLSGKKCLDLWGQIHVANMALQSQVHQFELTQDQLEAVIRACWRAILTP
ncbi:hypothetical protein ACV1EE_19965, partial [Aeromonas hydrophila]